jgi:hypothetical protein
LLGLERLGVVVAKGGCALEGGASGVLLLLLFDLDEGGR